MTDLAIGRACRAAAVLELAGAAWCATTSAWWIAALVICTAPSLLFIDALARRAHHRAREEAQHAARLQRGEQVPPLTPCCQFWLHSDGEVHHPACTRIPLPNTDNHGTAA